MQISRNLNPGRTLFFFFRTRVPYRAVTCAARDARRRIPISRGRFGGGGVKGGSMRVMVFRAQLRPMSYMYM